MKTNIRLLKLLLCGIMMFSVFFQSVHAKTDTPADSISVAQIESTSYAGFSEALAAAKDGDTIKLLTDVTVNQTMMINKSITLTSADATLPKKITTEGNGHSYLLSIETGGTVKLENIIIDGGGRAGLTAKRAAVSVNGGTLTLGDGSVIQNNNNTTARGMGGGVSVISGELILDGGTITGNFGYYGGGVGMVGGIFSTKAGSITGNHGNMGGAVCVWENGSDTGSLYLTGPVSFAGNTAQYYADGVNLYMTGNIYLSGTPSVEGGIYLDGSDAQGSHAAATINGALDDNAAVNFLSFDGKEGMLVVKGTKDYAITEADLSKLNYISDVYGLRFNEDGNVILDYKYDIIYELNGGDNAVSNPAVYVKGAGISAFAAPTKIGYTFKGWYGNADFSGNPVTKISETETGAKTLYAKWEENNYTVTVLNDGNGTGIATPASMAAGAEVSLRATPNSGYHFKAWEVVSGDVAIIDNQFIMPQEDVSVKAVFEPNTYSVTLNANGGSIADGKDMTSYTYGIGAVLPTAAEITRTGYTFKGWYGNADLSGNPVTKISETETGAKTLYAKWEEKNYTVTVLSDGNGTGIATPASMAAGAEVSLRAVPNSGYHFKAWEVSGDVAIIDNKFIMPQEDVSVKAVFEPNTYSVTLNANGGIIAGEKDMTSYTYGIGAVLPTAAEIIRTGYTFKGWYGNADFSGSSFMEIDTNDTGNKIFYAKWDKDGTPVIPDDTVYYSLNFVVNGGSKIQAVNASNGETIDLSVYTPTCNGYDFSGWYADKGMTQKITEIKMDSDKTIYAGWTKSAKAADPAKSNPKTVAKSPQTGDMSTLTLWFILLFASALGMGRKLLDNYGR